MSDDGLELTSDCPVRRFEAGRPKPVTDVVVSETRIEVTVNDGQVRIAMLCMPADLEALAVGFLVGEGALRRPEDLESVEVLPDDRKVVVRGDFDADALENLNLRWTWGSGCGSGGTGRDMDAGAYAPVGPGPTLAAGRLLELTAEFQQRGELWRRTGGVHGCALACAEGLHLFVEDVGRHNAFDKVVGRAFLDGIDLADKIVITTGRLSAEIASKAVACRVPILASRSAVTGLAVQVARRFGLTLVGFCRAARLNVYTGYDRITE